MDIIIVDMNVTPISFVEHIYRTVKMPSEKQITIILVSNLMTWANTSVEKQEKTFLHRITTEEDEENETNDKDKDKKHKIN